MMLPTLIIVPLIAGATTQVVKFIIQWLKGELRWSALREYGGMPSAHTAFVVSLDTVIWRQEGLTSPALAVAIIFSILIIRDAIGLRQYLSQHGRVLNMLIRDLPDDMEAKYPTKLVERMGHTPLQAFVGGCIGLLVGLLLTPLLPLSW